ncbi:PRD domain-containing protein [Listeria aquatica]|uniref:PRD domain-containing protein n=2 Tax=Listeria aquatica TaxID=1494960 RepID=A0A841ZIQ8_9LIST|nr:PRD domain-containing protein [Listeria aquatica]MBC1520599.1 PRD domain-containing protein [Listeria aquatica]
MRIKKILNNNAVLVAKEGKDFIWIGTGLGFKKRPGDEADSTKIERTFVLDEARSMHRFSELLQNISVEYASIADDIIRFAKSKIKYELSDTIYISLTDHISNLVALMKEGLQIPNQLTWEIKKFYPVEYAVGNYALSLIKDKIHIQPEEYEAGNIALHFINAQIIKSGEQVEDIQKLTEKIRDIVTIIRIHNKTEIDENSIAFDRFVTHLRFFFKRVDSMEKDAGNPLLVHVVEKYPAAYETAKLIENYLKITLYDNELLYLTLHIQKLIEN